MNTDTQPAHTPTPWHTEVVNTQVGHCWKIQPIGACIYVDNQRLPREAENQPSVEARANAAHIVKCVNAHEELLASLKEYKEATLNGAVVTLGMAQRSEQAIAQAEGH